MASSFASMLDLESENQALKSRIAELEAIVANVQAQPPELRAAEASYYSVLMALNAGVVLQAADGTIQAWNASAERILGLTGDQLRGRTSIDPRWCSVHEDGSPFLGEDHPAMVTLRTGKPCSNVIMGVYTPDQRLTWIIVSSEPLLHPGSAQPYAVVASFTDITEQVEIARALQESEARFSHIFHASPIGISITAISDGRLLDLNAGAEQILGYLKEELLGQPTARLGLWKHSSERARVMEHMSTHGFYKNWGTVFVDKNGIEHDALVSMERVELNGEPCILTYIYDITEWRQLERERETLIVHLDGTLKRKDALYQLTAMVNSSHELAEVLQAVVDTAADVLPADRMVLITIDFANQLVLQQIEGGSAAMDVPLLSFAELSEGLSGVVLRDREPVLSLKGSADPRESPNVQQRRIHDQAGSIIVVPIQSKGALFGTLTAINAPNGADFTTQDLNLLTALTNQAAIAIERAALLSELQHLATIDGLTQILNRRAWLEQSQRAILIAQRSLRPVSLMLLDADHFKLVNDTYGHDIGDQVLQAISRFCQQQLRIGDIIGRYGGEEFVILLPETDAQAAMLVAERIRTTLANHPIPVTGHTLHITISLGIASMAGKGCDLGMLLQHADRELYAAKQAGRNRACSVGL
jgi:diguanylate cyclase (GGDEF)-like protein/PAS domain S-box-containing protein